jgi:hypothetical protein
MRFVATTVVVVRRLAADRGGWAAARGARPGSIDAMS